MSLFPSKQRAGTTRGQAMPGDTGGPPAFGPPCWSPQTTLSCQALLRLCPHLGETDAQPLSVPKVLTSLELHIKWSELDKQWLQLQHPKEGVGSYWEFLRTNCDRHLALSEPRGNGWAHYSPQRGAKKCIHVIYNNKYTTQTAGCFLPRGIVWEMATCA